MKKKRKYNSPFRIFLRKFLQQRLAVLAFMIVLSIAAIAIFGPYLAPYDPHRPVTAQYTDQGIDIQQLTSGTITLVGHMSDGSEVAFQDLERVEAETEDRRVAAVRRTGTAITVNANTSGYTTAVFRSGNVATNTLIQVQGEQLIDTPVQLSQLQIEPAESSYEIGETHSIKMGVELTDGTIITQISQLRELLDELYFDEDSADQQTGFQTASTQEEDESQLQFDALTSETVEVDEDGTVTMLQEGEGIIQVTVGELQSLVQFQIGTESVEPIVTHLSVEEKIIELNDVYKHQSPSSLHLFGTDHQNRDIFSRVIHGAKDTLLIGFVSVAIGSVTGTVLGLFAGYYGGWFDSLVTRFTDILLAFPGILLAIAVIAFLGAGLVNIIFAVAVFTIPIFIRLVRGSTLALKEMTYVEAAKSVGVKDYVIIFRHIFPGTLFVVLVYLTMRIGIAILIGAALSFLGLGGDITAPEWGSMLSAAKDNSGTIFHATFFPGLAIVITVLSFNIFGDGLRDALDPKLKE